MPGLCCHFAIGQEV